MKLKELMFNNKKVCISVISGIVIIIVIIAAIVIKISSVNNSGQNDDAVALNNQSSETISDNKTKEMMSDENMTTKDSNLADSAETVEGDTLQTEQASTEAVDSDNAGYDTKNEAEEADAEKSDENVIKEAKAEENNAAENNNLAGDNNGNNSQQGYKPGPVILDKDPTPEPEGGEDHIVYKPDGSIDLNESYWKNSDDALKAIEESPELNTFIKYTPKKYNWTNGSITNMGWSGKNNKWNVYSYSYLIREKGSSDNIKFEFNGKEFVEK